MLLSHSKPMFQSRGNRGSLACASSIIQQAEDKGRFALCVCNMEMLYNHSKISQGTETFPLTTELLVHLELLEIKDTSKTNKGFHWKVENTSVITWETRLWAADTQSKEGWTPGKKPTKSHHGLLHCKHSQCRDDHMNRLGDYAVTVL